ncbi:MAG: hypothetical protein B5M53_00655 [Candidatus Cloacimonas sp. 4484_209]|nr:MAG: hypothetical protein B5M53_00655 [Candidatus Cloacimonas sp. 4484_209]
MKGWDKIFTDKGKPIEEYSVLYWYILNKPDYGSNIAENIKNCHHIDNITKSLGYASYTCKCLTEMASKELIKSYRKKRRKEKKRGRPSKYYKVTPAFLCMPFYTGGKLSAKDHFVSYIINLGRENESIKTEIKPKDWPYEITILMNRTRGYEIFGSEFSEEEKSLLVSSLNELLEFIPKISREPKEFLEFLTPQDLGVNLWSLIRRMLEDLLIYRTHKVIFHYPSPFHESLEIGLDWTLEKAKKNLKKFLEPEKILENALRNFKRIKIDNIIERIEKNSILDLKRINNIPKEEIPEKIDITVESVLKCLDYQIGLYNYLRNRKSW